MAQILISQFATFKKYYTLLTHKNIIMKNTVIFLILGLFFFQSYSQTRLENSVRNHLFDFRLDKMTVFDGKDLSKLNYTGSPYLDENYLPGKIFHKNQLIAENIPIRYNALMDEIEFKTSFEIPDDEASALLKSTDVDVRILNRVFIFVPYQGGVEKGGYFEVLLEDDNYDLFKKHNKKYTPEKKAETSITRDIPAKFTDQSTYFLVRTDGRFIELPSKNKQFVKAFLGKEKEMNQYLKENKLDTKEEKDIIRIVKHYNSIL